MSLHLSQPAYFSAGYCNSQSAISSAQRPAPFHTRCTKRLSPENNRRIRIVPLPQQITLLHAVKESRRLGRSEIDRTGGARSGASMLAAGGWFHEVGQLSRRPATAATESDCTTFAPPPPNSCFLSDGISCKPCIYCVLLLFFYKCVFVYVSHTLSFLLVHFSRRPIRRAIV